MKVVLVLVGLIGLQEARQGNVVPVERFESPMIVELPLVLGGPGAWSSALRTPEEQKRTRRFICDRIYVYEFMMKAGKPNRHKDVDVDGKLTLAAEHGEDRRVDVLAEIVSGGEVLATSKVANIKVEEDERSTRALAFRLTESQLADPSTLKMRLTLDVRGPQE